MGGLVGNLNRGSVTASYATGNVDSRGGADRSGALVGRNEDNLPVYASYGFGAVSDEDMMDTIIESPKPMNVSAATALTADNTGGGCDNPTYTTSDACVAVAKAPGTWPDVGSICAAPSSDPTDGVVYSRYSSRTECEAGTKTASTWNATLWNYASRNTLNAWVFASNTRPKLRYADYDGAGDTYDCDMFPDTIPGTTTPIVCGTTLLPGQ